MSRKQTFWVYYILAMSVSIVGNAQQINTTSLRKTAEKNLRYLAKGNSIQRAVTFQDYGLQLYEFGKDHQLETRKPFFLQWRAVPRLVNLLETTEPYDINKLAFNRLQQYRWQDLVQQQTYTYAAAANYKEMPTSLDSLVVAIDPGHFASNLKEAQWEEKWVKVKGSDVGLKKDVQFFEAELTDLTSLILETKLIAAGAKPFTSKPFGRPSIRPFSDWYKYDFKSDLFAAHRDHLITDEDYSLLTANDKDSIFVFRKFYRFLEFRKRVEYINQSVPNVTISIHYNAHENSKRDKDGYLPVVQENYSMAFVPGAFLDRELTRVSEKIDFLRLLLSNDIDKSARLAHLILEAERHTAGISQVPQQNVAIDERYCMPTDWDGVYARNLAITRSVKGPVVYLEALLQDNDREVVNLSKKDYEFTHPVYGKLYAPKRCEQIAEAVFIGLKQWVEENRKYASIK
ncbi:MAG: N-acetylmuramoyl-L-alanine amidase [Cytophagales bacterium]|nr:N-acetylmuramoyl-L-alanine amidase [Cytophagales bacterium]